MREVQVYLSELFSLHAGPGSLLWLWLGVGLVMLSGCVVLLFELRADIKDRAQNVGPIPKRDIAETPVTSQTVATDLHEAA